MESHRGPNVCLISAIDLPNSITSGFDISVEGIEIRKTSIKDADNFIMFIVLWELRCLGLNVIPDDITIKEV
ncbi:hypothetical protein ACT6NV_05495 [Robiginitalea sp. IMCC44478]|uniref:hypothetical protein n=1 Tax=Robiginitalea sp. IMCC44478 TaxID=3459122 RepID=UPI004042B4E7